MDVPVNILPFWKKYEAAVDQEASSRFCEAYYFDDNEETANALGDQVLQGRKQATAGLLWDFEVNNKPIPKVGDLNVITNWQQEPLCVIETIQVDIVPYEEVSKEFAAVEGEGDGSLRFWRELHWSYFSRECERLGKEPTRSMQVVCERFRLVYPN